jgi:deoxycytidylate deaminase
LSNFLDRLARSRGEKLPAEPYADYIDSRMKEGNRARRETERDDFLALAAVSEITEEREVSPENGLTKPRPRTAHVLFSLKRPEEVLTLRRIYGPGFYLIGVFATEEDRLNFLKDDKNIPEKRARELIDRDQEEKDDHGQRTRDTFQLADVFVQLHADNFKEQLWRFLNIIFGHPSETPSQDENAMFVAYAASARSASLSRQVGASVVTETGELVAIGCNDVPCAGGGLYWPGKLDKRDHTLEYDSNDRRRDEILEDIMKHLRPEVPPDQRLRTARDLLKDSPIQDITEYGRSVHAEMEALLACARAGVSPRNGTLYATTFPCHNCTRHIIGAGISRVAYIEPYPKSKAEELHFDAIEIDPPAKQRSAGKKVVFESFVGVGPRRYLDLFSVRLSTGYPIVRKESGKAKKWDPGNAAVRVPMFPTSYLQREQLAVESISEPLKRLKEE